MKHIPMIMTVGDKIFIGALVASAVMSLALLPGRGPSGAVAVIESENRLLQKVDLSQDRDLSVSGPLGETLVEIRSGRIRVSQSPCPHQICVKTGFRDKSGEVIACIPNRVVITIVESGVNDDIDAVTR